MSDQFEFFFFFCIDEYIETYKINCLNSVLDHIRFTYKHLYDKEGKRKIMLEKYSIRFTE